ncbi:uncharacterized protein TEOVI_000763400 [Trypanosoma equiperdum]|uniref:BTB domain-containing protein n=4 Tax=Trypanozoon TaxID=39700 RepID=Q57YR0_TRYB2|nr:hypothetical protein, conserved [Trypanosoma brucei gambiense DAL972]XP_847533.1 hypothetical protein, conserved [Trypanosoma brucei brucei TREU927]AAX69258.1 hypothetical protein, conserved [Trypanosoma brucei]RHW72963.1 hypothetical protein DPX39_040047000 [Trypanosoma brucei equiperdum]SCU65892.1 hypothetical protein, conserved [Trypanosoma equiperdum]AAZ13467.1 hypothetical protein, conserved [Trypanosoma brucei brucei TREU927]CBH13782.1 hypothetical protein, conserved [Trypanosoma bru|eukprot:XP_011776058.1 hypothetical protein, conserved [Trypanosoma brucei gambiense DAL972]
MYVDSDEEAAAVSTVVEQVAPYAAAVTPTSNAWSERVVARLRSLQRELCNFNVALPDVVSFRVDGKDFCVRRELLLKDPQSVLFLMAVKHFQQHTADRGVENAIEVPCRNPMLFGMLLNLLRGYKNPIPEAYRDACYAEARFYGLLRSWSSRYAVVVEGPFCPLPCSGRLFSDVVCATAGSYCRRGKYRITFNVLRCDTMAVGVISRDKEKMWADSVDQWEGFALCWNDGRTVHNFGEAVMERTGVTYAANARIRVELDCDEGILSWCFLERQQMSVVRLPPMSFAFVVVLARSSEVQIVGSD